MARGGHREGAGRKKKTDEESLLKMMDAELTPERFWNIVALRVESRDPVAMKLWASYRFGVPKQQLEVTGENGGPLQITGVKII